MARRLSTLRSFYWYWEQEGLVERSPAANVRPPRVDYESRTLGLDHEEFGAFLVQTGRISRTACDHRVIETGRDETGDAGRIGVNRVSLGTAAARVIQACRAARA